MDIHRNPIVLALDNRGIRAPDSPLDLSDAFKVAGVQRKYVICITGRCGSTWLAETLAQLPYCGLPNEYFSEEAIPHYGRPDGSGDFAQYVRSLATERQTAGAFGLKIDVMRLEWLSQICDLARTFSPETTAWVDMRRLNLVKQAFSFARAKASGVWHVFESDGASAASPATREDSPPLSDAVIWREMLAIIRNERLMDQTYTRIGVQPLSIFYEELLDSKLQIMQRILQHIFPRRSLKISDFDLRERTQKLAGDRENDEELAFLERNATLVNAAYQFRNDRRLDIETLVQLGISINNAQHTHSA